MVKVVKVKMVKINFGYGHLLTIYKYNIYIIVADFDIPFSILTNDQNDQMTASLTVNV